MKRFVPAAIAAVVKIVWPSIIQYDAKTPERALLSFRRSRQGQPSCSFIGGLQAASRPGHRLLGTLGKAEGAGMENGLAWAAVGAAAGVVMCSVGFATF
jgi:hypothetical protein